MGMLPSFGSQGTGPEHRSRDAKDLASQERGTPDVHPESQGQNLALTVLHVPCSLDMCFQLWGGCGGNEEDSVRSLCWVKCDLMVKCEMRRGEGAGADLGVMHAPELLRQVEEQSSDYSTYKTAQAIF